MGMALSVKEIRRLLKRLNEELARDKVKAELYLAGGAVMCLVFKARESTNDLVALFEPKIKVADAARRVAKAEGLDEKWLNDAVKGFMSAGGTFDKYLSLSHLNVFTAQPQYLLAMKCLSFRIGYEFSDEDDVRFLLRYLNIDSLEDALAVILSYYPRERLPQKAYYALQEMLQK